VSSQEVTKQSKRHLLMYYKPKDKPTHHQYHNRDKRTTMLNKRGRWCLCLPWSGLPFRA